MAIAPIANAAYQAASKLGSAGQAGAAQSSGFGDFLSSAMKDAIGTMKAGEQAASQQAAGKGDIVNVVNAVNQAEITLDTVVAVRDKVIQAYQSIMQMPI
jgi:flagellar hook-basal body complex protein FliE